MSVLVEAAVDTFADALAARLQSLVERAGDRIAIIAGGTINATNVRQIVAKTGVRFVHARSFRGLAAAVASG